MVVLVITETYVCLDVWAYESLSYQVVVSSYERKFA